MRKNIVIAGLIFWNLILMAALIYVWANWRGSPDVTTSMSLTRLKQDNTATTDVQEFTFKAGEHLNGDVAPQIAERALTITALFDSQQQDGVIIAQGGLAHGYALFVQDGELLFCVRRNQALTIVSGGKLGEGQHKVTATFAKSGDIGVILDARPPAIGKAAGAITFTPVEGLDVGADRGAPVGPYAVPNSFGGTIETVIMKTAP